MLVFNSIDEEILSKKYKMGRLSRKGKEYHFIYKRDEEEVDNIITDVYYAIRLMPLPSDIKEKQLPSTIRYRIGVYRFEMNKKGAATIRRRKELLGEEWNQVGNEALKLFISYLANNKDKIDVTFDYGIFEIASLYPGRIETPDNPNIQTTRIWDEFTITMDIRSFRNDEWIIKTKSGFKIIESLL